MESAYLIEETLSDFLTSNFEGEWIHDKCFKSRFRPDYRNDQMKLIVEFDGCAHYTQAKRILTDIKKDKLFSSFGYTIVRIPYFIQLSNSTCKTLFNKEIQIIQSYPHGFIDNKCVLPADFCELGIEKFKSDLKRFQPEQHDIITSLVSKIKSSEFGIRTVLPKSLEYLVS